MPEEVVLPTAPPPVLAPQVPAAVAPAPDAAPAAEMVGPIPPASPARPRRGRPKRARAQTTGVRRLARLVESEARGSGPAPSPASMTASPQVPQMVVVPDPTASTRTDMPDGTQAEQSPAIPNMGHSNEIQTPSPPSTSQVISPLIPPQHSYNLRNRTHPHYSRPNYLRDRTLLSA